MLCVCEVWGQLLVPWSKITTVVYAKDGELLRAAEESPPVRENASWQATGVPKSERVDGPAQYTLPPDANPRFVAEGAEHQQAIDETMRAPQDAPQDAPRTIVSTPKRKR